MITASELERELASLHRLAYRLMPPLNRRPHLFHESKAELIEAIARLQERLGGVGRAEHSFCSDQVDAGHSVLRMNGRDIPVGRRRADFR